MNLPRIAVDPLRDCDVGLGEIKARASTEVLYWLLLGY